VAKIGGEEQRQTGKAKESEPDTYAFDTIFGKDTFKGGKVKCLVDWKGNSHARASIHIYPAFCTTKPNNQRSPFCLIHYRPNDN